MVERTDDVSNPVILVVDDEPLIVRLMQVNLERAGYRVVTAGNGQEALQRLRTDEPLPALILMDGIMPYMDGFETLSRLKADPDLQHIPVVMTSARSRDADLLEGEDRGAIRYLAKPINPAELLGVVQDQIGPASPN